MNIEMFVLRIVTKDICNVIMDYHISCLYLYMCVFFVSTLFNFHTDPKNLQLIGYRFCRRGTPGCLNDLYDGNLYTERSEFFSSPYNLSLTLNYDGAPEFKSSTMQIWPVQMMINELPPHLRYKLQNCVSSGMNPLSWQLVYTS